MDRINILISSRFDYVSLIESLNIKETVGHCSTKINFHQVYSKTEFEDTKLDICNILIANSISDLDSLSAKKDDFNYIFLLEEFLNQKILELGVVILISHWVSYGMLNFSRDIVNFFDGIKSDNVFMSETEWIDLESNTLKYQNAVNLNLADARRKKVSLSKEKSIFHFLFFDGSYIYEKYFNVDDMSNIGTASKMFLPENVEPDIFLVDFYSIWNSVKIEKQDRFKLITVIF